ncbi:MAG TPA: polysaccharide deacetylase family protein [Candidatus Eisenbacteria bacterium]|nr:polysaccharide deacetylase family protein [Candidatus Eisenbacteria bacterium]
MTGVVAPDGLRAMARSIRRTARRARSRLRRASVVLLYHRVAEGFPDPWSLCVSPANFREQMLVLLGRDVVTLDTLAGDVVAGRRRRSVVVTFDDGYADFEAAALPVLHELELPATLFVTTSGLDGEAEFWWDELERIVLASPSVPDTLFLEIGGGPFSWSRETDGDRRALHLALHRRIGRLPGQERQRTLRELRTWAGADARPRATHRPLSSSELAAVARDGLVRVGAHTVSHSYLGGLASDEQAREVRASKERLEAIVGTPVEHFSYPHGDHTPDTIALVRAAGFRIACGSACKPVTARADVFDLPRVEVPNLPGEEFERWLDEWVR